MRWTQLNLNRHPACPPTPAHLKYVLRTAALTAGSAASSSARNVCVQHTALFISYQAKYGRAPDPDQTTSGWTARRVKVETTDRRDEVQGFRRLRSSGCMQAPPPPRDSRHLKLQITNALENPFPPQLSCYPGNSQQACTEGRKECAKSHGTQKPWHPSPKAPPPGSPHAPLLPPCRPPLASPAPPLLHPPS